MTFNQPPNPPQVQKFKIVQLPCTCPICAAKAKAQAELDARIAAEIAAGQACSIYNQVRGYLQIIRPGQPAIIFPNEFN